jgi:hypothetical protein
LTIFTIEDKIEVLAELLDVQDVVLDVVASAKWDGEYDEKKHRIKIKKRSGAPLGIEYTMSHEMRHAFQRKFKTIEESDLDRMDYTNMHRLSDMMPEKKWRVHRFPHEIDANGFALMFCEVFNPFRYEFGLTDKFHFDRFQRNRDDQQRVDPHDGDIEGIEKLKADENAKCAELMVIYGEELKRLIVARAAIPPSERVYKVKVTDKVAIAKEAAKKRKNKPQEE